MPYNMASEKEDTYSTFGLSIERMSSRRGMQAYLVLSDQAGGLHGPPV